MHKLTGEIGGVLGCKGGEALNSPSGCQGPAQIRVWGQFQENMFHGHVIRS